MSEVSSHTGTLNAGAPNNYIDTFTPQQAVAFTVSVADPYDNVFHGGSLIKFLVGYTPDDGTTLDSLVEINLDDYSSATETGITFSAPDEASSSGPISYNVPGPGSAGTQALSISGNIAIISNIDNTLTGIVNVTVNGTATSWGSVVLSSGFVIPNLNVWAISADLTDASYSVEIDTYIPKVITLLSAGGYVDEPVTLLGDVTYSPPNMDVLFDGTSGGEWETSLSFTLDTGADSFQATAAALAAGPHTAQVRDSSETSVVSNTVSFTIGQLEVLEITAASCAPGGTISMQGTWAEVEPSALNLSIDSGAFDATANFATSSGTATVPWTADSTGTLSAGFYSLQVEDPATGCLSNMFALTVGAPERIQLTASGSVGQPLVLSGNWSCDTPVTAMDYTIDDGATWALMPTYDSSSGTLAVPWNGLGETIEAAGNLTVIVRDHTTLVESNPVGVYISGAIPTWTPPQPPSQEGSDATDKSNLVMATFGDNYVQRAPNGLNFEGSTQNCTWQSISAANWEAIEAFFLANMGSPFYYAFPGDPAGARKWNVTKFQRGNFVDYYYTGCTCTLTQDYTPDPDAPTPPAATTATAFDTWTPPVNPSTENSGAQVQARVNASNFGDSYVRQKLDGLNPIAATQNLSWSMVTLENWLLIEGFLKPRLNGVPFFYTFPGDPAGQRLWTVQSIKRGTWNGDFYTGNSATLSQDFTPTLAGGTQPGPPAPSSLTVIDLTMDEVVLSIGASAGATEYLIFRASVEGDVTGTAEPIGTTTSTTYADTDVTPGDEYIYYAVAENSQGVSAPVASAPVTIPYLQFLTVGGVQVTVGGVPVYIR